MRGELGDPTVSLMIEVLAKYVNAREAGSQS